MCIYEQEVIKVTWINSVTYTLSEHCAGFDIRHPDPRWATMTLGEMFL